MPNVRCPLREAAQDAPQQTAIITQNLTLSFSELDSYTSALCQYLHQIGIRPSNRLAVFHPLDWRLIALFFAAWRLGAVVCPLNTRLPPAQIASSLSRLSPSLYITDLNFPFKGPTPYFTHLALSPDPLAFLLFTSGSSGTPKIAALSLSNLLVNARHAIEAIDLKKNDRWLLSLPLFHVGGIGIVLRCILARAAIVLDERDPNITHISYVPAQLYKAWPVYKNLRCVLLGGSSIASYPGHLPIYGTYGLTEMGSLVTARLHPPFQKGELFLGHPLPGRELRIAPDGEILLKGKCLFEGYWEEGRTTLPLDEEGWFATGDIGHYCKKEGLAILGRKDWQFISGGENIQPEEIEKELLSLPQIEEAVVVPLKDPEFGHRPAAVVRLRDSAFDLKRIQTALSDKLPKYKIPAALLILDEIPKNSLKADRKQIFELVNKTFLKKRIFLFSKF